MGKLDDDVDDHQDVDDDDHVDVDDDANDDDDDESDQNNEPSKKSWDGNEEKNEETPFARVQAGVRHHPCRKQSPFCPEDRLFMRLERISKFK